MSETAALWAKLKALADPEASASLERETATASDRGLARMNPLAFAAARGLNPDDVISTFVHATRIGLFDLSWNMLCPGCGGVLQEGGALKSLAREHFYCALCAADYRATLDELVEATFTVNPRVRRVAAHDPDTLPNYEYVRQVFWGSWVDAPDDLEGLLKPIVLDAVELAPGEKAAMNLVLPAAFSIVFDPATHTTEFLDVAGEPTTERRNLSFVISDGHSHNGRHELRPGPVRIAIENRSARRALPGVWVHNEHMDALFSRRRPFLTATRLMSNQAFRDVYRNATLDPDRPFKITNLTILFTDLSGSTLLYDRVGDLAAFDIVRRHFAAVLQAICAEGGAVVKTIGDAVMATFAAPDSGLRAAMRMRQSMRSLSRASDGLELALKIGLHEGPCLAVTLDDRSDYFGQAVNVASRVQTLAEPSAVLATRPIVANAVVAASVSRGVYRTSARSVLLRGVSDAFDVYEIAESA